MKTIYKLFFVLLTVFVIAVSANAQSAKAIPATEQKIFRSHAWTDGYILESEENSGVGLTTNNTDVNIFIGDDNQDRQYVAILSFRTRGVPDNAVITMAKVQLEQSGSVGDPSFGSPVFEVRSYFGASDLLEPGDFESTESVILTGVSAHVNQYETKLFGPNDSNTLIG